MVGGGATLSPSVGRTAVPVFFVFTDVGGGATTSAGPKIRPIKLLTKDELPEGDGGGGAIALLWSGALPAVSLRISAVISVEGGGATVAGAGRVILGFRTPARSGAETGGGTTAGSIAWIGAEENCRLTADGAGGVTSAASAGVARNGSRRTFSVGAGTDGSSAGATKG